MKEPRSKRELVRPRGRNDKARPAAERGPRQTRCPHAWRLNKEGRQGGFTLIELLVVILIAGILSGAVLLLFSNVSGVFHSQQVRIQNQDDARLAINQMARFIRMATSSADNTSTLSNSIITALPQDIEFYCDVDGDGHAEKVRYYLQGTNLRNQVADPVWISDANPHWEYPPYETDGVIVQDGVRNGSEPLFRYRRYDAEGNAPERFTPTDAEADRRSVVGVDISLRINEKPELAREDVVLETFVQIRQRFTGRVE